MRTINIHRVSCILIALGLLAYILPWLHNPPAGLTFAAYDLAEWSSLHPAVRDTNPPLLTSLFLRIPLPCLLLGALFATKQQSKGILLITLLIAAALLPPFEFLTQFRSDPNYQQQFVIAFMTLLIGILAASRKLQSLRQALALILLSISFISAFIGVSQAAGLMNAFNLPASLGLGMPLHSIATFLAAAQLIRSAPINKTGQPLPSATLSNNR